MGRPAGRAGASDRADGRSERWSRRWVRRHLATEGVGDPAGASGLWGPARLRRLLHPAPTSRGLAGGAAGRCGKAHQHDRREQTPGAVHQPTLTDAGWPWAGRTWISSMPASWSARGKGASASLPDLVQARAAEADKRRRTAGRAPSGRGPSRPWSWVVPDDASSRRCRACAEALTRSSRV